MRIFPYYTQNKFITLERRIFPITVHIYLFRRQVLLHLFIHRLGFEHCTFAVKFIPLKGKLPFTLISVEDEFFKNTSVYFSVHAYIYTTV